MSDDGKAAVSAKEAQALDHVARSVRDRYPGVPTEAIAERVRSAHQRYADARVRDFVPLLVERELMAELRASGRPS
ncbi:three-helix bundle dimerization domain-containing protein [Paractinoplanes brasiliensis]|nr:hypothetical protein [Actinoplanes brasiliensis]